ncbi:MAG: hypothetical protein PQJ50_11825 [Spirochaetales bacterium]|nr:hypothetical protein [Spirochaetales bacterium]
MKKTVFLVLIFIAGISMSVSAQTHNSVPISETALYHFLDQAEMRGYTGGQLRAVKPYPKSYVVRTLERINKYRNQMSSDEREVFQEFYDKYVIDEDKGFWTDGDVRVGEEDDLFTLRAEIRQDSEAKALLNDITSSGGEVTATGTLSGDVADNFSWALEIGGGAWYVDDYNYDIENGGSYDPIAWEPYTFSKGWDGGIHKISSLNNYYMMPGGLGIAYTYNAEINASFFDNRMDFRFGRLRRDWGVGEGNLFLSSNARPFVGIEGTFNPWHWFSLSFITGTLEYGENYRQQDDFSIKGTASTQQNMFAMLKLEFMPTDWLYFAINDSGVYLKRPELGYIHPLFSNFFFQNNVGDYDNMALGGTVAVKKAGLGKAYFSLFLDEARFNHPDFFSNYANMYSYQAGIEAVIPGLPWTTALLQYTKIEPFCYTHYTVDDSPWYSGTAMETAYMNNGESLGYGLEPNSDEIMLKLRSQPKRGFTSEFGYRMIRHGITPPGSTFNSWVAGDSDGAYDTEEKKNFLKDGIYEWFHVLSIGGTWDLTSKGTPVAFGAGYSYVFHYYTDYESNGGFKPMNSSGYENEHRHIVTLSVSIFP